MALGLFIMVINRASGMVVPATTKYLMDNVFIQGQWNLLPTLAMAAGAATLVDAVTSFATRRSSAWRRSARSPTCARTSKRT